MKKNEHIEFICMKLQGLTKLNFQINLGNVLEEYYLHKNLTYEMPSPNGGDDKNDGWVVEEELFYQIYAPTQLRTSLPKDIQNKFKEDLEGLLTKLNEGKWNGKIKKFVFLVNTFDDNLPKDSSRFFETTVDQLKKEKGFDFEYQVVNLKFIKRLLRKVDDFDVFYSMQSMLGLTMNAPVEIVTNQTIYHFLSKLGNQIMTTTVSSPTNTNYKRISTQKKIDINDLNNIKGDINKIIDNLYIVEEAVTNMNQNIDTNELFENVVKYVVSAYSILAKKYDGIELFNNLCNEIASVCGDELFVDIPTKYIVVYIFDHCDIFKKEEVIPNVNTK